MIMGRTLLSAKATATTGNAAKVNSRDHGVICYWTGVLVAMQFALLGSIDGTNYAAIKTYDITPEDITALACSFSIEGFPVEWVKGQIVSVTAAPGVTPSITMSYMGGN